MFMNNFWFFLEKDERVHNTLPNYKRDFCVVPFVEISFWKEKRKEFELAGIVLTCFSYSPMQYYMV